MDANMATWNIGENGKNCYFLCISFYILIHTPSAPRPACECWVAHRGPPRVQPPSALVSPRKMSPRCRARTRSPRCILLLRRHGDVSSSLGGSAGGRWGGGLVSFRRCSTWPPITSSVWTSHLTVSPERCSIQHLGSIHCSSEGAGWSRRE